MLKQTKSTTAVVGTVGGSSNHAGMRETHGVPEGCKVENVLLSFLHCRKANPNLTHESGQALKDMTEAIGWLNSHLQEGGYTNLLGKLEDCWAKKIISKEQRKRTRKETSLDKALPSHLLPGAMKSHPLKSVSVL